MIRKTRAPLAILLVTVIGLTAGAQLGQGNLDVAVTMLSYLVIAQGWNILGGYGGQISLGAAAFVGLGGYGAALLMLHTGAGWLLGLAAGGLVAGVGSLVLAVPLLRLRGDYFAVGTLAAAVALDAWMSNWQWAGGTIGLTLPFNKIPSLVVLYRASVVVGALALATVLYVKRSAFGLRLTAVRDHEQAAEGLGVSAYKHRLAVLVLSSVLTGIAGALIAVQSAAISPDGMFALSWSLAALLMTFVGGAGTFTGPIIGVLIVYYGLTKELESAQTLATVIEGALLIVIVRFAPQGVWPLLARRARRVFATVVKPTGNVTPDPGEPPGTTPRPSEKAPIGIDAEIV